MGVVYLNDSTLSDIADAIRYKENSQNIYYPDQMGNAIRNLGISPVPTNIDTVLIPELSQNVLNTLGYSLTATVNFDVTNELPTEESRLKWLRVDIEDSSLSKEAYLFSLTESTLGLYANVNNLNNINIMSLYSCFYTGAGINFINSQYLCGSKTFNMAYAFYGANIETPICSDAVKSMSYAYYGCTNLIGPAVSGRNVTDMSGAYQGCSQLTGNPACGLHVTNMYSAYENCTILNGNPICGDKVENFSRAYNNCRNLTGSPVVGPNVTNMYLAYNYCSNLTGDAVFSSSQITLANSYLQCTNLTGMIIPDTWTSMRDFAKAAVWYKGTANCGINVTDMTNSFYGCSNLVGNAIFGESVAHPYLNSSYYLCNKLTGIEIRNNEANMVSFAENANWYRGTPYCPDNTSNAYKMYYGCFNLTGSPVCGNNITNYFGAYYNCWNITGNGVCGDNVVDMISSYANCYNLNGTAACGDNVQNMYCAFYLCNNLAGPPVVGANVYTMYQTYAGCTNMIGSPVCGDNVNIAYSTYLNCYNITGNAVIGNNVVNAQSMYRNCNNITGIGDIRGSVILTDASYIFANCTNLQGYPYPLGGTSCNMAQAYYECRNLDIGNYFSEVYSVWQTWTINASYMFYNCPNIYGNIAFQTTASKLRTGINLYLCFWNRDNSRMLNIYVPAGYSGNNWIYNVGTLTSTTKLTWTMDSANSRYYNTTSNIYVYYQ